jgi:hypothetical protein
MDWLTIFQIFLLYFFIWGYCCFLIWVVMELSRLEAGGALTFSIAEKVSKKSRLKKGDCAHTHLCKFLTCCLCAPCMINLSHGSVWHLCFVYTGKHPGFTFRVELETRFVNTITGFWAGFVVRRRVLKNRNILMVIFRLKAGGAILLRYQGYTLVKITR